MRKAHWHFKILILCLCLSSLQGMAKEKGKGFFHYEIPEPGFFHYKDPEEVKEEKEKEKNTEKQAPGAERSAPPQFSKKELWNMHPKDFEPHLIESLDWSVKTLKVKDVEYYKGVEDIARRKASAFSNVTSYVNELDIQKNSFDKAMPVSVPGKDAKEKMYQKSMLDFMKNYSSSYSIIYLSDPNCTFCKKQDPIIEKFVADHKEWTVIKVNITEQPEVARRFNVRGTPTLTLIKERDPEYMILSQGVITLNDLVRILYRQIRIKEGKVDPKQYHMLEDERGGVTDPLAYE